jgi:hypothetical protein
VEAQEDQRLALVVLAAAVRITNLVLLVLLGKVMLEVMVVEAHIPVVAVAVLELLVPNQTAVMV